MAPKIAIIYDFFSEHGGIERIMMFQARMLKKAGYEVTFAFAYVDEKLKKERLEGFKVIEYANLPVKNETFQICSSVLRKGIIEKFQDFNLIICHSFPASYLALRIKNRFNVPYILHLHHPPQFLYNADLDWAKNSFKRKFSFLAGKIFRFPLRKFDNYCVRNADEYFAESKVVREIIKKTYGIDSNILYPTVDPQFKVIKTNLRDISNFNIHKNFILASGRIIRQKRFDYLIDAFSMLPESLKQEIDIVVAGKCDDKEKGYLQNLAKEKRVNIIFVGPLEKSVLVKFYNLAKLTALTCPKEWFGLVPIEAMSCGCPVVAWKDNFGPQESVTEGKSGFLAKPYDIKDFSKKIEKTLTRKWNKQEISRTVRKFSDNEQSKVLFRVISKVLN